MIIKEISIHSCFKRAGRPRSNFDMSERAAPRGMPFAC